MPILEYLMVYTESGLPIYSKCYGNFCKTAFKEPELLSGFLSAIETIPPTLGSGLSLESIQMGPTQMRFSKTTPGGQSVVIGLSENRPEVAETVFRAVNDVLAKPRFNDIEWTHVTGEIMNDFENELVNDTLPDALHSYGGFSDDCPLGDQCPIHTTAYQSTRSKIWGAIKDKYAALKRKMMGKS
ncbi:hypothetical protein EU537_07080 [Candidatus Thorarchaeota archaeon]|nr:MAG: hypothetical protein EU537_07080 [Candidatus Thorarchaeota archaeon]